MQLPLAKPGENTGNTSNRMKLNLSKGAIFSVLVAWDSSHDLDVHAFETFNDGNTGAKIPNQDFGKVLSTYNAKKTNPNATLPNNADGSFSTLDGSLTHSGDSRTGIGKQIDEIITIDGSKVPSGVNEIPIFVTIHPGSAPALFRDVKEASITIKDDQGKVLGKYELTQEFGGFNCVQLGSMLLGANGWEYAAVGSGFSGDFNTILGHFA